MSRGGPERKPDSLEKRQAPTDDSGQWAMLAFNQITDRLDRIDARFDRVDARLDRIEGAVGNLKKVVWTAAGVILALGFIASVVFGFTDLVARMIPVEITIRSLPAP